MAIHGEDETIKKIDGAFALVWYNGATKTLNLTRNDDRPLHLIECSNCWIISSELGLGLWIAERSKFAVTDSFQLETKKVYTFNLDNFNSFTTREVENYKWVSKHAVGAWKGHWPYEDQDQGSTFQSRRDKFHKEKEKQKSNVIPLPAGSKVLNYGDPITFKPDWLEGKDATSCLIYDDKRMEHFIIGEIEGSDDVEVRIYGKYQYLLGFIDAEILRASVMSTTLRKGRKIYCVDNVKVVQGLEGDSGKKVEVVCGFCGTTVSEDERVIIDGEIMCRSCAISFKECPELYQQMGLC